MVDRPEISRSAHLKTYFMQIKMRHIWSYFLQLITMCWKYSLYILLLSLFQTNLKFIFYMYLIKHSKVFMDIKNVDRYGWLSSLSDDSNLIKYISVSFFFSKKCLYWVYHNKILKIFALMEPIGLVWTIYQMRAPFYGLPLQR